MTAVATETLRVVHTAPVWLPRTQTWMHTQVAHLPGEIEAHVVCECTENLDDFGVARLHCLADSPMRRGLDKLARAAGLWRELGHLRGVARQVDARVLHSHFGHIGWQNLRAAEREGLAHVVTFYGQDATLLPWREPRWRGRYAELFASVDAVLAEGTHFARTISALGCPDEKLHVHHLGVELERFAFRARTWRSGDPLRVLIAGSFTQKKGIPFAIEALARLREEFDVAVTVIGDAGADPRHAVEKHRILDTIERTGMDVRLLGFRSHAELLAAAYEHHVLLSPSVVADDGDAEGGAPVTILELAATGMPVVSTLHCDIPEVLGPDGHDLLAAERDVDGLVERLLLLAADPAAWAERGAAVRAHIEHEYDARTQGARLAELYARVA